MSKDIELELYSQFQVAQEKYRYFLLAIAASAIGFVITQTKIEPLSVSHVTIGMAVLFWSLSFISGIKFIEYSVSVIFGNHNIIVLHRLIDKQADQLRAMSQHAEADKIFEKTTDRQQWWLALYGNLQSYCLFLGAIAYIGGVIFLMYKA